MGYYPSDSPMVVCACAQNGSNTDPDHQLRRIKTSAETPLPNPTVNNLEETGKLKLSSQHVTTKSISCTASNNYQPNTVISSNLNADKWMKGYPNNEEKDFQSIVDVCRSIVTESSEQASMALENSKLQMEQTKNVFQDKQSINNQDIDDVASALAVSNDDILDVLPTKEHSSYQPNKQTKTYCTMVDKVTSDKVVKDVRETVVQASAPMRDSGVDSVPLPTLEQKSTNVFTSRYVRAESLKDNQKGNEKSVTKHLKCNHNASLRCRCKQNYAKNHSRARSTQTVFEVLYVCPRCCIEVLEVSQKQSFDTIEEYVKSYLSTSCRYYSHILGKHIERVKENLKKQFMPPRDGVETNISKFIEACTMKPSGKQNHCCQTIKIAAKLSNLNAAWSATDFRGNQDKQDLKTMYYILTSIEGRIRRLKINLHT